MLRGAELTWKNCKWQDHREAWKRRWTKLSGAGGGGAERAGELGSGEEKGRQLEGGVISDDMTRAYIMLPLS